MNEPLIVGIVGRIGSGKSAAAKILSDKYQFLTVDVDRYGHTALEHEKETLVKTFGGSIIGPGGQINRQALGEIVFTDPEKLNRLNSIVHPRMKNDIRSLIKDSRSRRILIDAALLYEMGLDELCRFVIAVDSPDKDIIARVKKYRNWEEARVKKVLKSQEYIRFLNKKADFIVKNHGGMDQLEKQLDAFMQTISSFL